MALQSIIFLLLCVVILALMGVNGFFLRKFYLKSKEIDEILEGGKIKDFKEIFLSQKNKNKKLEEEIAEAFLKIKNLEDISEKTIQKKGIVRFNPFNDIGGNQSFIIALLDDRNDGFVISSLFYKEGNRVYAKSVKNGKSEHILSDEEKKAIENAIKS